MPTPKKESQVEELKAKLKEYDNLIITDYRGLSVEDLTELRKKLYEKGVVYQVIKNNLVRIALKDAKIEGLDEYLSGPTAIAFSKEEPVFSSKVLVEFAKKASLKVKGGFSEGKVLDEGSVNSLSKLPSKEVLMSMLLGSLNAPATKFVSVLNNPIRKFVNVLEQISKQKA